MPKELIRCIRENTSELKKFNTSSTRLTKVVSKELIKYLRENTSELKKFNTSYKWVIPIVMLALTFVLLIMSVCDIPNYPSSGYRAIPTETYSYIDTSFGDHTIYETDYTVKHSKLFLPIFHNFSIYLPPKSTSGFIIDRDANEQRGFKIISVDAPTGMVRIENIYEINPILLSIKYTSGKEIVPEALVYQEALLDIQNDSIMLDSFYLKVENRCNYDIKTLRLNSNVTDLINLRLTELKDTSWINQRVMIYDRGLPVDDSTIDARGVITWNVNSIEPHEQKIYYFKKVKST